MEGTDVSNGSKAAAAALGSRAPQGTEGGRKLFQYLGAMAGECDTVTLTGSTGPTR